MRHFKISVCFLLLNSFSLSAEIPTSPSQQSFQGNWSAAYLTRWGKVSHTPDGVYYSGAGMRSYHKIGFSINQGDTVNNFTFAHDLTLTVDMSKERFKHALDKAELLLRTDFMIYVTDVFPEVPFVGDWAQVFETPLGTFQHTPTKVLFKLPGIAFEWDSSCDLGAGTLIGEYKLKKNLHLQVNSTYDAFYTTLTEIKATKAQRKNTIQKQESPTAKDPFNQLLSMLRS